MLNIETTGREIRKHASSALEIAGYVNNHIGIIEGYLHAATSTQLIKDPETLGLFINYLAVLTGALSTKAAELDRCMPEIKTLIRTARALANSEEAGNVEE